MKTLINDREIIAYNKSFPVESDLHLTKEKFDRECISNPLASRELEDMNWLLCHSLGDCLCRARMAIRERIMNYDVLINGLRAKGRKELEALAAGEKLSKRQQILAKCYDCTGGYADGAQDCECHDCPLYPSHPYNPNREKKVLSEKQKAVLAANTFGR